MALPEPILSMSSAVKPALRRKPTQLATGQGQEFSRRSSMHMLLNQNSDYHWQ